MKKKITNKKQGKYSPSQSKKDMERKRLIQEKRQKTINLKKRSEFIDYLYKKYE